MEIEIISEEIIKPSSPTPHNLRTYKLSIIDQINSNLSFSIILFYSKTNIESTSDHLKQSLSNTLTYYYPLAGRHKDDFCVDCDDSGAGFIEAHIADEMCEVLRQPEIHLLEQLLPFKPHERSSTHPNLSIQVNNFGCGGMAIGICFKHDIVDGSTAGHFVKTWAALACGANDVKDVISDNSSVFPPQDVSGALAVIRKELSLTQSITKRFNFDGTKIASLREEIKNGTGLDHPTRFEVVSAIILGAVIAAVRETDATTAHKNLAALFAVDLRQRMNPPFPPQCMGNLALNQMINWPIEKHVDYSSLVGELGQVLRMVDDQYARKQFGPGTELINFFKNEDQYREKFSETRIFFISSWCRFPFYQTDFGWGKPVWVGTGTRQNNSAILIDSCDGEGIEAWVGLPKEDMARFERDPSILQYASFNSCIC